MPSSKLIGYVDKRDLEFLLGPDLNQPMIVTDLFREMPKDGASWTPPKEYVAVYIDDSVELHVTRKKRKKAD